MHIKSVTTENFGVLKDNTYTFSDAMNIIRGPNESGKSTIIEAVLYGMFGTSALRGKLEDVVREGKQPSDLSVEVGFGPYTIKRRKSSASIVGDGVKINGQSAVSDFLYDLLGVRKGSESSVLVSEQGSTAGILNGKPGEVSALIEGLADFNQIDEVVENVKEKFPSGNTKLLKEMRQDVGEKLAEKEAIELTNPNIYLDNVRHGKAGLKVDEVELSRLLGAVQEKESEIVKIEAGIQLKSKLSKDIEEAVLRLGKTKSLLEITLETSLEDLHKVSREKDLIGRWPEAIARWELYKKVTSFEPWEGEEWDGDIASLDEECLSENKKVRRLTKEISDIESELRTVEKQINGEAVCPTCGQDTAHLHEELNKKAEAKKVGLNKRLVELRTEFASAKRDVVILENIQRRQDDMLDYKAYAECLELLPWNLKWIESVPLEPSTNQFHRAQDLIRLAEDQERKVERAKDDLPKLDTKIELLETKLEALTDEYDSLFTQDPADLKEIVTALKKAYGEALEAYTKAERVVESDQTDADRLTLEAKLLEKEIDKLKEEYKDLSDRLKKDGHNYEILKQVRKARGKVLNRVWSNVLNMVSVTFSDLRGVESRVEKSEKGFLVNGLPVPRLSGSGKSVLGIALRVALREVFAPAADFMVFDEASADCDKNRTAAVTAALAMVRGQVISITHEDVSDGSADNIIELEAA